MDESFSISVSVDGRDYSFDARLVTVGYTHRFIDLINGLEVFFEPDEERKYRAILNLTDHSTVKDRDMELIKAVASKIEAIH